MLDQSFSYENFRIILDVENRKGNYLEDPDFFNDGTLFQSSRDVSKEIIELNELINLELAKIRKTNEGDEKDYTTYNELLDRKVKLKEKRENALEEILTNLSKITNEKSFKIEVVKGKTKHGSQLYTHENKPEDFFVLKQLQRNIYKTFKVKQADRKTIVSQLRLMLNDGFPKVIIRTDIKNFYETILHSKLLSRIEENSLLSFPSKKIIKEILNQYWNILVADGVKSSTDIRQGIPRGFGISAYLSELYMRNFDKKASEMPNVTYYARYVDDIIIITTPESRLENRTVQQYRKQIKDLVKETVDLEINADKTSIIDLRKDNNERKTSQSYSLTYLGYKYLLKYKIKKEGNKQLVERLPLEIKMSDKKLEKYRTKITISFNEYNSESAKYAGNENRTNRLLLQRIKFLSNNFQLVRRKSNVFIGIYFSNEFLSNTEDLESLDTLLKQEITRITNPRNTYLTTKLHEISFKERFLNKNFMRFNFNSFQNNRVLGVWKNL